MGYPRPRAGTSGPWLLGFSRAGGRAGTGGDGRMYPFRTSRGGSGECCFQAKPAAPSLDAGFCCSS